MLPWSHLASEVGPPLEREVLLVMSIVRREWPSPVPASLKRARHSRLVLPYAVSLDGQLPSESSSSASHTVCRGGLPHRFERTESDVVGVLCVARTTNRGGIATSLGIVLWTLVKIWLSERRQERGWDDMEADEWSRAFCFLAPQK